MRVSHVITRLIVGGAQENTAATVLGLRSIPGVEVELISGPTTGPEGSIESLFQPHPGLLTILPSLIRPPHPWHDLRATAALARHFRATSPDLVHTHSGKAGFVGRLAARLAGIRCIIHTIHGPSFGPFQGAAPNFLYRAAERLAGRVTHHFISVAQAMTAQYLAAGIGRPEQYTRIFSGFPLEPFLAVGHDPAGRARFGIQPGDFVIAKIARLFELKGHDDLFAAAPAIVRAIPNAKFLLIGDGPWRGRFEELARAPGLAGHFIFTGLVPPSEIPSLLALADVVVHLSLREGLPRALSQALAAARPVVAYDCDGAGEVCLDGRTGFLIPPRDLALLEKSLLRLARDETLRRDMGQAGRAYVRENFSVEKMVADIFALYRRLLKPAP